MESRRYYERPEAELLVVRFEKEFLTNSPEMNSSGNQKLFIENDGSEDVDF